MRADAIIAIDGPASSGKTTLGRKLAGHLGYLFFDSGVMYRAVAYAALQRQINVHDEAAISRLAESIRIDVAAPSRKDGRDHDLLVDGQDVTWEVFTPEVDRCVSIVAAYPAVRAALSAQQRRIGRGGRVVMVGRDIGTVVLPEADLKIYLDAAAEERAGRRYRERLARGESIGYDDILETILNRDAIDSSREVAPLMPAADAILLNSDELSVEEVFAIAIRLLERPEIG